MNKLLVGMIFCADMLFISVIFQKLQNIPSIIPIIASFRAANYEPFG